MPVLSNWNVNVFSAFQKHLTHSVKSTMLSCLSPGPHWYIVHINKFFPSDIGSLLLYKGGFRDLRSYMVPLEILETIIFNRH